MHIITLFNVYLLTSYQ